MEKSDSPIGQVITLHSGTSRAEITTVGAHLRRFEVDGRAAIVPFGDDLPWGAHGAVLAPWPNRIAGGSYTWQGRSFQLPITEAERNTAIHGLVMGQEWAATAGVDHATLTTRLEPSAGYPFPLLLRVCYDLRGPDLTVSFSAENLGEEVAPFGVGFHPWLAPGPAGLEAATLEFDVGSWFPTDSRLIPLEEAAVPEHYDFTSPRVFGDTAIDDAFGRPGPDAAGRSWVHLRGDDGITVSAWMHSPLQIWQLCSEPGPAPRGGLAVEPMSCPADAFNSGDRLHSLVPGVPFEAQWGLRIEPAGG